jgi:hypothetical protein
VADLREIQCGMVQEGFYRIQQVFLELRGGVDASEECEAKGPEVGVGGQS